MGLLNVVADVVTGGAYSAIRGVVSAAESGPEAGSGQSTSGGSASDDSALLTEMSENQLAAAQAQASTMALGILQSSVTAQFRTTAWLAERMDSLDTKLQVATIEHKNQVHAEHNRHVEAMAKARNELRELQMTHSMAADLPPPSGESE
jgi:hypothetical protein